MTNEDRLDSWKEIAAYLKRDVRTVQRWEASESLPVHRHRHKKRGSVFALRHELDAWRESRRAEFFTPEIEAAAMHAVPAAGVERQPAEPPAAAVRPVWALAALAAVLAALTIGVTRNTSGRVAAVADAPRLFGEALREGGRVDRIAVDGVAGALVLSPDQRTLFVALCGPAASDLQAINLADRTVKWTVHDLRACTRPAASPDGARLFLADGSHVTVVEAKTGSVRRIQTPASSLRGVALMPDGRTIYAAAGFTGLLKVDAGTGDVTSVSRLPCPVHVLLSPGSDRLYVSYQCSGPGGTAGHDAVDVIDTRTDRSVGVIRGLPLVGGELAATNDGSQIWMDGLDACHSPHYDQAGCPAGAGAIVNVVRAADHLLIRSLRIGKDGEFGTSFSMTPDGSRVVLSGSHANVLSTATLRVVESSPMRLMGNVVFTRDEQTVYAVLGEARSIAVLPATPAPAPPPGLTARWTMDGHAYDGVGENDFEAAGHSEFEPGRIGLARRVREPQALRIDSPTNLDIQRSMMTAMAWIRIDAESDRQMVILEVGMSEGGTLRIPGG